MDRPIYYAHTQLRGYDLLSASKDALLSTSWLGEDFLYGLTETSQIVVSGLVGVQNSPLGLSIIINRGRLYQLANVDGTAYGTLAADFRQIIQQGSNLDGTVVALSTAGLTSGHSRWALVQATIGQSDVIPGDDPTSGVLGFYNSTNPNSPILTTENTARLATVVFNVKYGTIAATGSEVPPNPDSGYTPLFLIDLAFGQTTITTGQILTAGPSVGVNVPSNYPVKPSLAGLLNSHHSGVNGQAPQIHLDSEVQGTLPIVRLPASSGGTNTGGAPGGLIVMYAWAGNPNGHVAGNANGAAGVNAADMVEDTTTGSLWICTTTGNAAGAVWTLTGLTQAAADARYVLQTTQIITSSGLTGGAALSGNVTLTADIDTARGLFFNGNHIAVNNGNGITFSAGAVTVDRDGTLFFSGTHLSVTYGTVAGTAAQGNDSRIVNALQSGNNLGDVANAATSRSNLGFKSYTTANYTPTAATQQSEAHGLGALPANNDFDVQLWLVNVTGEFGYSAGDVVKCPQGGNSRNDGATVWVNGTNVGFSIGNNGCWVTPKNSGNVTAPITASNWEIYAILRYN